MTRLLFLSGLAGISMILGGLLPLRRQRWSQQALLRFMAFGSGVLLGAAFLFIIPEAVALGGSQAGLGLAGAFVAIFAMEQLGLAHCLSRVRGGAPLSLPPDGLGRVLLKA